MAIELSLETLTDLSATEFVKAFKNKAAWKKAKFVLVMTDFKLGGKKLTVALPFKKPNEAKDAFKKIKKEKMHALKKVGIGSFELTKGESGPLANIEFKFGGLSAELAQTKASKLFDKIKLAINMATGADAEPLSAEEEAEVVDTDDHVEEYDDTAEEETDDDGAGFEEEVEDELDEAQIKALEKDILQGIKIKDALLSKAPQIEKLFTELEKLLGK